MRCEGLRLTRRRSYGIGGVGAAAGAQLLGERLDDARVELCARAALEFRQRLLLAARHAVSAAGDARRRHRVVRVGDEHDPRRERDLLAGELVGIARAVPPLVVVENALGHRVDAEALEHPVADLRMALEHEPLGVAERRRLPQQLLRDRELAEVVEVAAESDQLDRRLVGAEPARDPCGVLADALRVPSVVRVARVDRLREALGRAVAGRAVGAVGELLEIGAKDRLGRVRAHAVLAVLLRPVERTVGEPDQFVASDAVRRKGRDAAADGHLVDPLDPQRRDALDDRPRHRGRLPLVVVWQEDGELVAPETERLAALSQARRDLAEHLVAHRMAVLVVDRLEVVEVEEAERNRRAGLLRRDELALEPLVEAAVIPEARERIGEREPHRLHRLERRPLVERDREQRPDEGEGEERSPLPEDAEDERGGGHERERRASSGRGSPSPP